VKDVLLFPWRILRAILGYLNFFSMIYGREPLRSAGGPKGNPLEQDVAALWLHGRMIDLASVSRDEGTWLGPDSWQLRARSPYGQDSPLASRVVSFDRCDDGGLLYRSGF